MTTSTWTPTESTPSVFAELSGDYNPVHLDEAHAQAAGFDTVIVHGMCVLGAAARAAHSLAPTGSVLRELDVRFANPVLPGQSVRFEGSSKERDGRLKVSLKPVLENGTGIMSPANFTFGSPDVAQEIPRRVSVDPADDDVVGDVFQFDDTGLHSYLGITCPSATHQDEGIPPMVSLLGMTGALEKAFQGVEPEKPGTWVHLRQQGVFYQPVQLQTNYVCRIQSGQTIVRTQAIGAHVTIPFVVELADEDGLVATGACVLLYAFDREEEA